MKKPLFIILLILTCSNILSQQRDINTLLDKTLSYRGLTREDVTIPVEFFSTAEKNPTNESKLVLPLVQDIMVNPLRSMTWLDSMSDLGNKSLMEIHGFIHYHLIFNYPNPFAPKTYIKPQGVEGYAKVLKEHCKFQKDTRLNRLKVYNKEEIKFISENIFSILEDSDADPEAATDIFIYNKYRDSSINSSKRVMDLLSKLNSAWTSDDSKNALESFYHFYEWIQSEKIIDKPYYIKNSNVQGNFYYYSDEDGIRIAIGDPGKNIYTGDFDFIIDLGGDDIYNIDHPPLTTNQSPLKKGDKSASEMLTGGCQCIIDLAGNDYYTTSSDFALAGGLFSSSFIFDKEGDDFYESKGTGNLGAAIGGLGLLYDEKGNDTYKGISFSIGAGCFGVGLLVDREGNDFYIANSYSQGFGMTEGVGCIVDNKGNDSYLVDSRSLDIGRYNDHYVSMCQGYGLGLRPFYAGGIGLIIEGEGNDIYNTDIFGQGGAYWYSLGAIVDKSGHDKYNSYQYGQGAGIHLAVGLLKDYDGWDFYQSNGVSQGCGHDFGFGMLWDVKGNDNYSAYSLSQGAGNADGIGILIDESGTDGYLNKYPSNTRGYGNPRREYGSIGVLLDASGSDYYSNPGYDSTFINSSSWGVFTDYEYKDLPEQVSGDNYKVPLDTHNVYRDKNPELEKNPVFTYTRWTPYYTSELFIMAKTIEPRFSLWQDYGFKKLIEDSTNTAKYIVTKFNTTDHRDVQVFRVLSQKIQWSIAQVLKEKLDTYSKDKSLLTQAELSMICYIFGETKDPSAKEQLLQLTYDDNYRVRSSAINALGKINYDKSENDFIERVTKRLSDLARENSEKKLYNKDIAFALGNYITPQGLQALFKMLANNYYGARFIAAENLKKYSDLAYTVIGENSMQEYYNDERSLIAFIQAMAALNSNDFKLVYAYISLSPVYNNEAVVYNLMTLLKYKIDSSGGKGIDIWFQNELDRLQQQVPLNIK